MAKQMPNSELKIYKDATHMIPFENAEQVNQDILEFMKK
jgi:pimeloyl-ACP methyl ester carboxylesterase